MKHIVCYSGGKSSALVAVHTVKKYGAENTILLNHNISSQVEHKDIKRFKNDVSEYLNVPITYSNLDDFENLTPLNLSEKIGGFQFQVSNAVCTYNLKTLPFYKYLENNFPSHIDNINNDCLIHYGFDKSEKNRIQRRVGLMAIKGYYTSFPLATENNFDFDILDKIGIKIPITYKIFKHANCIGCLKAGQQHWYIVYCLYPHIFNQAKFLEKSIGHSIIKNYFLEELENKFYSIKSMGICPNENQNNYSFWKDINSNLPEQQNFLPCECSI